MDLNQLHKFRDLATSGKWKEVEALFNKSIQLNYLGAHIDLSNPERPRAILPHIKPEHGGGIGTDAVHGGIIASMADLALGLLGLSHYKEGMTATAQLTVHYLKPFRTKSIVAEAITQQVVGNRIFGTVELSNDKGEVCAIAYGALAKGISL
ncbi:MAG TPA: PaaI family thioesterase [Phnomibacter sp.]|nr:PaaI family thioesterase [Phnomibacter sp.]